MDENTNYSTPKPKGQQSGQINFQRWSVLNHPGTKEHLHSKRSDEYKMDLDGQIKRIVPKVKKAKRTKRAQLRKIKKTNDPDIKLIKVGNKWVNERV